MRDNKSRTATLKTLENNMILIIGDTNSSLSILYDYLRGFGFKVLAADDGESGLAIADHADPDIILMDAVLPGMDGFETCRQLKSNRQTHTIPVVFITTEANTVDKMRGFALGAVDYITKPIQSEEVLARLKTHLTIQRLQKRLEEKNARLHQEITEREKLIEELDAFAHTVAHDLKNPLSVTINYAQFLAKYGKQITMEDVLEYADNIVRNGHKMSNIIDELLLLASVRTEETTMEPLDMDYIVEEAKDRLAFMIKEYEPEFVGPEEWPISLGYGPWVEEIWANYISNAIKYGGQPPRVEIGADVQPDGTIKFWVQDNGPGLKKEEQEKLFVQFTRLNQVRAEGHGLGLSIVQRIIEKLKGRVSVESEGVLGKGSRFSFYLPQYQESSTSDSGEEGG